MAQHRRPGTPCAPPFCDRYRWSGFSRSDNIAEVEAALVGQPLIVPGSRGQLREHPLLSEPRQQRAALSRLLRMITVPEADSDERTAGARSHAGRALARARWQR